MWTMNRAASKILTFVALALVVGSAYFDVFDNDAARNLPSPPPAVTRVLYAEQPLPTYTQGTIEMLYFTIPTLRLKLIVFDGNTFKAFSIGKYKDLTYRYVTAIPLMVHALKTNFPERFKPGQPPFQMVWSIEDMLSTSCANAKEKCPTTKFFPPIISFSTVHRDGEILPTAKSFPNPHFITCLYRWKIDNVQKCEWQEVDNTLKWEDLTPTILWRGSDFLTFLSCYDEYKETNSGWMKRDISSQKVAAMTKMQVIDQVLMAHWSRLTPRWKGAALTLKAKVSDPFGTPWIDTMFTGTDNSDLHDVFAKHGLPVAVDKPMDAKTMSKARYQIDYGGGGGTTWQGTLTKLRMPGALFHHETQTKDWFYDMMEPWKHFIPVRTDLEDLHDRYEWAESHPVEVKAIAEQATQLAETLLSAPYMEATYEELFVRYLGQVVQAYNATDCDTWEACVSRYKESGILVHEIATCDGDKKCHQEWMPNTFLDVY